MFLFSLFIFYYAMFMLADGLMRFIVHKGTYVENLTEVILRDWNHLKGLVSVCEGALFITNSSLYLIKLVNIASSYLLYVLVIAQRRTGETFLNEKSSRSHQILKLVCLLLSYILIYIY